MTIYFFAYDNMINVKYIKSIIKYKNIIPTILNNYKRHWILCNDNRLKLGIYKKSNHKVNGILLEIDEDILTQFTQSIKYNILTTYVINQIDNNLFSFPYMDYELKENDIIYTYIPRYCYKYYYDNDKDTYKYLMQTLSGCNKISNKFLLDFLLTTHRWKNI